MMPSAWPHRVQSDRKFWFPWCGWLLYRADVILPLFLVAISGMFCWDRRRGEAENSIQRAVSTPPSCQELPAKVYSLPHNSYVHF